MTKDQIDNLRFELRMAVAVSGRQAWCLTNRVSERSVGEFIRGERAPGKDILSALGYELRLVRKDAA